MGGFRGSFHPRVETYLVRVEHHRSTVARRLNAAKLLRKKRARVRDAPQETLRRRQGDIRVRLPAKLPKRADAETQVLGRKSGESIAHKYHALKRYI